MRVTLRLLSSVVQRRPFYVTTPIFYVNAAPHLGHLYTAVVADAIQRFEKLTDPNCNIIFSTGTDEHGTKIQQAAAKANLPLPEYCTSVANEYMDLFKDFHVQYTDFIRTTEERHKRAVTHFWNELVKADYIYKAKYSGWYSVNDECFVPDAQTRDEVGKDGEPVKVSVESGHRLEWTEETNYMFRLSAFKTHLQTWLKTDGVITPSKFQEQLRDMLQNEYLPDISVSRPSSRVHWAIRVPGDETQSIYVWLDALVNYLTVAGYPEEEGMRARGRAWPVDVHVIGKDILKFHGVYWPAFLMGARWAPPRRVVCHAHWTADGAKMSKSVGNAVRPGRAPAPPAALRYLLLREGTMHSDANYSETKLINTANSELADTLGNLASRCCGPALNPRQEHPPLHASEVPALSLQEEAASLLYHVEMLPETCHKHYTNYQFYKAVDAVIATLHLANLFFETNKPWELRKRPECQKKLDNILHITMETLRITGIILQPIIPDLCEKLLDKLLIPKDARSWQHCETPSWRMEGVIYESRKIQSGKFVLFQRIYRDKNDNVETEQKSKEKKKVSA